MLGVLNYWRISKSLIFFHEQLLQKAAGTVISFYVIVGAYAMSINAMKMQMNY